jgi:predicted HicB family RNase H-like nuclease
MTRNQPTRKKPLLVRLEPEMHRALERAAALEDISMAEYIRERLAAALKKGSKR